MSRRFMAWQTACTAAIVGVAIVSQASPAWAQGPGSRQTRDFVQAAAQSDQFEIMEAHTALAQSTTPAVRRFAEAMIRAHQETSVSLYQAATAAGLAPPKPGLGGDQAAFLAALQSQRGTDFDQTYVRQQILAHQAALAVDQGYASTGDSPTIKQAAAATVPVIIAHIKMIEEMRVSVSGL